MRRRPEHVAVHLGGVGQAGVARCDGLQPSSATLVHIPPSRLSPLATPVPNPDATCCHEQTSPCKSPSSAAQWRRARTSFQPVSSCASSAVSSWLYLEMSRCSVRIMIMATMPLRGGEGSQVVQREVGGQDSLWTYRSAALWIGRLKADAAAGARATRVRARTCGRCSSPAIQGRHVQLT